MGTAITPEQLKLLGGIREEIVLALDADRAGREAMLRAQRVAGSGKLRLLGGGDARGGGSGGHAMGSEEARERLRAGSPTPSTWPSSTSGRMLDDADSRVRPGATGRSTRWWRCWRRWGTRSPARRWPARWRTGSRRIRRWSRGGCLGAGDGGGGARPRHSRGRPRRGTGPGGGAAAAELARAERAGAAGDVHRLPAEGRKVLERLTDEHSGPTAMRARDWLEASRRPDGGIDREDEELLSLVQRLVVDADREPASAAAMEINLLKSSSWRCSSGGSRWRSPRAATRPPTFSASAPTSPRRSPARAGLGN